METIFQFTDIDGFLFCFFFCFCCAPVIEVKSNKRKILAHTSSFLPYTDSYILISSTARKSYYGFDRCLLSLSLCGLHQKLFVQSSGGFSAVSVVMIVISADFFSHSHTTSNTLRYDVSYNIIYLEYLENAVSVADYLSCIDIDQRVLNQKCVARKGALSTDSKGALCAN